MSPPTGAVKQFGSAHPLRSVPYTLPAPKVVLCDLDGTLIDSMPILADLATDVMEEVYGTPRVLARELYVATCGLPFFRQLESIFPRDLRNPDAADRFEARKPDRCDQLRMSVDVERALQDLKRRGVAVVVSSNNGLANVAAFARQAGFAFDLVLGFGDGLAKGAPHIDRAATELHVERSQMLFVGDSLHDGEIAEAERIGFVGVAGTFSYERFTLRFPHLPVIRRFSDLPSLLFAEWSQASEASSSSSRVLAGRG